MVGDIGRTADLILVPGNQATVFAAHQIRLDRIGSVLDRLGVGRKRMFGTQRAGAAMGDYEDLRGVVEHGGVLARDHTFSKATCSGIPDIGFITVEYPFPRWVTPTGCGPS